MGSFLFVKSKKFLLALQVKIFSLLAELKKCEKTNLFKKCKKALLFFLELKNGFLKESLIVRFAPFKLTKP